MTGDNSEHVRLIYQEGLLDSERVRLIYQEGLLDSERMRLIYQEGLLDSDPDVAGCRLRRLTRRAALSLRAHPL